MDAYTLGAFAIGVGGIILLVWLILRAVMVLSLAHRDKYNFSPLEDRRPSLPPIPPPTPPPPIPPEEDMTKETQIDWPTREPG
jgi:hypothetical protein